MKYRFIDNNVSRFDEKRLELGEIVETTKEWYYHMFESVPPRINGWGFFVSGEPYSTIDGVFTYSAFWMKNGRYFSALVKDSSLMSVVVDDLRRSTVA